MFLSMGIHIAHTGQREKHTKMMSRISAGVAVVLSGLATAQLGIRIKVYLEFYFQDYYRYTAPPTPTTLRLYSSARQLDFAFVILSVALSIAMTARALQVRKLVSASKTLKVVSSGWKRRIWRRLTIVHRRLCTCWYPAAYGFSGLCLSLRTKSST